MSNPELVPLTLRDTPFPPTDVWYLTNNSLETLPLGQFITEIGKAGFDLPAEYARRFRLQKKFGREKGDKIWVSGVTDEVTEYAFEYSRKDVVRFPPPYEIVDGRLYSTRFEAFADEIINPNERRGAVLQGLHKVQDKLTNTPPGSFILWSSPAGPLGTGNREYDYSWTHVFYRNGTKVNYVCLRSDFTLSEHARFLKMNIHSLGMPAIRQILETPVVVLPDSGVNNLRDIGEMMSFVRANYSDIVYQDKQTGKKYSFDEMIANLQDIEKKRILELEAIGEIADIFEKQLLGQEKDEQTLRIMGKYLLAMNYFVRGGYKEYYPSIRYNEKGLTSMLDHAYSWELVSDLQKVGGCAGGTKKQNTRTFTNHTSEQTFTGKCPVCGKLVTVDLGEKCPGCKTVYACG